MGLRSKMFDNLLKVIRVENTSLGTATVSTEIDFDLPRGFIAKIKKVLLTPRQIAVGSATEQQNMALVRDPDDTETVQIPANSVEHDVIADFNTVINTSALAAGENQFNSITKLLEFGEDLDIVTARNMRFNSDTGSAANITVHECEVYYTLEKISSDLLLNLLDIL